MRISRNLVQHVVTTQDPVRTALAKINKNSSRQVFVVSTDGTLKGVLTDGDFRRWIVALPDISLEAPVSQPMNTSFVRANFGDTPSYIEGLFSQKISSVPLIDETGRLVAIAWRDGGLMRIGDTEIGEGRPAFLIAEIGNNNNGDLDLAKHLVDLAAQAGADCAKFQLRSASGRRGPEYQSRSPRAAESTAFLTASRKALRM